MVIVNPEHYAVALKYDSAAPRRRSWWPRASTRWRCSSARWPTSTAIETLELPPLARAIYNTSQVQQQIPAQLYQAVSQVLNYVLQLNAFRAGRRTAPPRFP